MIGLAHKRHSWPAWMGETPFHVHLREVRERMTRYRGRHMRSYWRAYLWARLRYAETIGERLSVLRSADRLRAEMARALHKGCGGPC